jgi:hypothetical protein
MLLCNAHAAATGRTQGKLRAVVLVDDKSEIMGELYQCEESVPKDSAYME